MAGDWIKMREDLHEDPAVLRIASKLGNSRPEHVVGYLLRFWSWISRNTVDGVVEGVRLEDIEAVLNLPNFCRLLCEVGWLEFIESPAGCRLIVPNFERHLSNSAKRRATETRKKQAQRACPDFVPMATGQKPDKTGTREEKRREEKRSNNKPPLPPLDDWEVPERLDTPQVREELAEFVKMRRRIKKPIKSLKHTSRVLRKFRDVDHLLAALDHVIANEYQGLKAEYGTEAATQKPLRLE